MRYQEKRPQVLFTYRYEQALHKAIHKELARRKQAGNPTNQPKLILEAFQAFAEAHNKGTIDIKIKSDFLVRVDKKDRITRQIVFPRKPKIILARMAFTFILSQAEVLRLALEWYFRGKIQGDENYYLKVAHEPAIPFIATIKYNLYDLDIKATHSSSPLNGLFPP